MGIWSRFAVWILFVTLCGAVSASGQDAGKAGTAPGRRIVTNPLTTTGGEAAPVPDPTPTQGPDEGGERIKHPKDLPPGDLPPVDLPKDLPPGGPPQARRFDTVSKMTIDLSGGVTPAIGPADKPRLSSEKMKRAALNYLLNLFSDAPGMVRFDEKTIHEDKFGPFRHETIELEKLEVRSLDPDDAAAVAKLPDVFDFAKLELVMKERNDFYPYACPRGERPKTYRLDWLAFEAMKPAIYYEMQGVPKDFASFMDRFKVDATPPGRPDRNNPDKVVVESSHVAAALDPEHPEEGKQDRIIELHKQRGAGAGLLFVGTLDRETNSLKFKQATDEELQDIRRHPLDFVRKGGGEYIVVKPNNRLPLIFAIFDEAGKRLDEVTTSIATAAAGIYGGGEDRTGIHPDIIQVPLSCMTCHRRGYNVGSVSDFDPKTFFDPSVDTATRERASRLFLPPEAFKAMLKPANDDFRDAMKWADIDMGVSVLPELTFAYLKPLDGAQIAHELNATQGYLKSALEQKGNRELRSLLGLPRNRTKWTDAEIAALRIPRARWASNYCDILNELNPETARKRIEGISRVHGQRAAASGTHL